MSLKIGADTQRKEHQAQSDGMSNIYLWDRKCNSYKRRFYLKCLVMWKVTYLGTQLNINVASVRGKKPVYNFSAGSGTLFVIAGQISGSLNIN